MTVKAVWRKKRLRLGALITSPLPWQCLVAGKGAGIQDVSPVDSTGGFVWPPGWEGR